MQIKKEAAQITAEQTRLLFNGLHRSIPVSLLLASTLAYVQWPVIEHAVIIGWLGALLVVNLLRALLAVAYTRVMPLADQAFLWKLGFAVGVGAAGAIWGLGAWLLYPPESIPNQAFLGVLMAGLTAGAVATLVASRTMTLTFLLLTLAPLALRFLSSDHPTVFTLGILTLLFLGVSTASSRNLNASILQNIRLRLEGNTREAQLRESEAQALKLSRVADRTDNGVIITDRDGKVEWTNDGFTRISGYTLAELAGRTPGSVLQGPETDQHTVQHIRESIQRGTGFTETLLNYSPTGRPYWVSIEAQPIMDEAGTITQFMAIERDITEQLEREQQLEESRTRAEEANQVKSRFLAMMSHEVRTPLNGVLGSLGLLQETVLDSEQRKYVTTGRSSAEWLLAIINNILDFSKMEAGRIEPEAGLFNVRDLLDSVIEIMEPRVHGKPVRILSNTSDGLPEMVKGDAGKIRQVLLNLASNAVKFTKRGQVTLSASPCQQDKDGLWLRFSVTDTGAGISAQDQQRLFEEFWSGQQPATMTGTGLGLTISRQLVEVLGGEIDIESQPGSGSCFWFDIPLGEITPEETAAELARRAESRQRDAMIPQASLSGRILIAEDNPANQMITQSLLSRLGLSSDVVANGLEAVEALRNRPYDLVLMDIGMPEMDGIEATRTIRSLPGAAARTPITALTAHVMSGEREQVLSQGLDDYLAKPVDPIELSQCLARWLPKQDHTLPTALPPDDDGNNPVPDALIDQGVLQKLFEDVGSEMAPRVFAAFIQELQDQTSALEKAGEHTDLEELGKAAHRLKGSAASFGASHLSTALQGLEETARNGDMDSIMQIMPEVIALAGATLAQLLKLQAANTTT